VQSTPNHRKVARHGCIDCFRHFRGRFDSDHCPALLTVRRCRRGVGSPAARRSCPMRSNPSRRSSVFD
jgi:hypothetical protein